MKTKLYDFSASTALTVCAAYAVLLLILGMLWYDGSTLAAVLFFLILASFLLVCFYYVTLAPSIRGKLLSHGDKKIFIKDLRYKTAYDERFHEKVIVLWDKKTEIKYLSKKDYKKKTIRVQATKSNLEKLGEWLGETIPMPEKPPRRKLFRRN